MKQLIKHLTEYLKDDYSPEQISKDIADAIIKNVKPNSFEVIWSSGVHEKLKLQNGKLICTNNLEFSKY